MKTKKLCRLGCLSVLLIVSAWSLKPQAAARSAAQADRSPAAYAAAQAPRDAILPAPRTDAAYGKIPLQFVPNEGQLDGGVAFYIQGRDKTVHFTSEGLTFTLNGSREASLPSVSPAAHSPASLPTAAPPRIAPSPTATHTAATSARAPSRGWVVKLDFVDANPDAVPVSLEESGALISYFKGAPAAWKTGLRASSKIAYRELWPGIDLIYHGTVDRLKYEFIVHPGADPSRIRLAYRGADSVTLTAEGRLEVSTPAAVFSDDVPIAWQEVDGKQLRVPVGYVMDNVAEDALASAPDPISHTYASSSAYGFNVGEYDRSRPLIIDPAVLIYCGFIGGSSQDSGQGIAVDSSGNAYITGRTESIEDDFPVTVGPRLISGGSADAFVAKIDASGTALVYCGYIGGSDNDLATAIAVDASGNAYVTGVTYSTEATFPVVHGPDLEFNGGIDAFVAKVDASGTALVYCGYIGGSESDYGFGIAVDGSGNAYVAGATNSTEDTFPVVVGPDLTHNGGQYQYDAFVAKVDASGTELVYCGYIGGSGFDSGSGIAVDNAGNAYVTGGTNSTEATFPVKIGPDLTHNGGGDAFVAKINASGTELVYCGYIGGSSSDDGKAIAVDGSGNAYITGYTVSTEDTFPVKVGPDLTFNGWGDAYVAKIDASGAELVYCGYIGGSDWDSGSGIAVDSAGNAYVTGGTNSAEDTFPIVLGPDLTYNGGYDAFVAKVDASGTSLVYCGYIGGSGYDHATAIAVDGSGNAYVTGHTESTEATFPVTAGPDLTHNGAQDAFAAKVGYADLPALTSLLPARARVNDPAFVLTATGSGFIDGAAVMWDGDARPTTFVNSSELNAQIGAGDLAAGRIVQVTVANPPPVGGSSEAVAFPVTTFTMGSTPASATVAAGQSASYTIQVTPQFGSFDSAIAFSCTGLPGAATASFSPASVTPGAGSATTMLTVTTRARPSAAAGAAGAIGVGSAGIGSAGASPPAVLGPPLILGSLLALLLLVLFLTAILPRLRSGKPVPARLARRRLAACAVICLIALFAACSAGDGPSPTPGTPAGTYQITVQGASGGLTVSTTVTLVVN